MIRTRESWASCSGRTTCCTRGGGAGPFKSFRLSETAWTFAVLGFLAVALLLRACGVAAGAFPSPGLATLLLVIGTAGPVFLLGCAAAWNAMWTKPTAWRRIGFF